MHHASFSGKSTCRQSLERIVYQKHKSKVVNDFFSVCKYDKEDKNECWEE